MTLLDESRRRSPTKRSAELALVQLTKEHMWAKTIATVRARLLMDGLPSPHVPFVEGDLCI